MNKILLVFALAVTYTFAGQSPAYAYLDPGMGSLILQGLIGGIAAVSVTCGVYWQKIRSFFSNKKNPEDDQKV